MACPTASIHTSARPPATRTLFPRPAPGAPGVSLLGHHSAKSYGATPYLAAHAGFGNIMVDCPRWSDALADCLQAAGGVRLIVLTHADDVADHAAWAARFGAQRVMHQTDLRADTAGVESVLTGPGPWALADRAVAIHTPGHTAGSISLLFRSEASQPAVLFTGDTLAGDEAGDLSAFPDYCWWDYKAQLASVAALRGVGFVAVLPGHGRPAVYGSVEEKDAALDALLLREGWAP